MLSTTATLVLCLVSATLAANPYTEQISSAPGWMDRVHAFERGAAQLGLALQAVFLGDAFMDQWQQAGAPVWAQFAALPSGNLGIDHDRTQNVLWRVNNASIANVSPKVVTLEVGGGNLDDGDSVEDVARGVRAILATLARIMPATPVLLNSVFPKPGLVADLRVRRLNRLISTFADNSRVFFLDLTDNFSVGVGTPVCWYYDAATQSRLNLLGYYRWAQLLKPYFTRFGIQFKN